MVNYDIAVIGGGPGGYVAAIRAAQLGAKVALIEKDSLGGTCLNYGCIPTKALFKNAELLEQIREADKFGIELDNIKLDMGKVQKRKQGVVSTLTGGVAQLLKANKVDVFMGAAKFANAHSLVVGDKTIEAKNYVIATGSAPVMLPIPGASLPNVIDSKKALEIEKLPSSMVIIGGGVIGIEMAGIFNAFGVAVTVVEFLPTILPMVDSEISTMLTKFLKAKHIKTMVSSKVEAIEKNGDGASVVVNTGDSTIKLDCDTVLMAVGRAKYIDALGLETINVAFDKRGIKVDDNYQTNVPNIYAIGDVTGRIQLAHVASAEGKAVVEKIMGHSAWVDYDIVPNCIFTFPEIACVGLSEDEAKKLGKDYIVGKFMFRGNGKALTLGETQGMVKLIAQKDSGCLLGMQVIGPHASDLIHEGVVALKAQLTLNEIINTIHAHPTLAEVVMEACEDALGGSIHGMPKSKK